MRNNNQRVGSQENQGSQRTPIQSLIELTFQAWNFLESQGEDLKISSLLDILSEENNFLNQSYKIYLFSKFPSRLPKQQEVFLYLQPGKDQMTICGRDIPIAIHF